MKIFYSIGNLGTRNVSIFISTQGGVRYWKIIIYTIVFQANIKKRTKIEGAVMLM